MMRYCPLCIKNGLKRKIKAFQINFEEAVWACEAENCPWPINHDEITFFQRNAHTCNWNEELSPPIGIPEESIPISTELLLYTPPVTPGGELSKESTDNASTECSLNPLSENKLDETLVKNKTIYSSKEPTGSLPILDLSKVESINLTEERRDSTNEENASICKTLPKIVNIQKTRFDVTILNSKSKEHFNETIHKRTDATITNENILENTLCKEIDLDTQCKIGNKQSKNSKVQLNDKMNEAKTSLNTEILSETDKRLFDTNDTNNLSTTNNSLSNNSEINSNIDEIIENILSTRNQTTENVDNDWLNSLIGL
ncbi:uncharacterized protein [Anoplolepis gracilipes]